MNNLQKNLLELRKKIVSELRAELMGPGSEVSYPDVEHELISEYPAERYSVGVLYPRNRQFGDNDSVKERDSNDDIQTETQDEIFDEKTEDPSDSTIHLNHKDDAFNDEVNMAQQNKPSSMGMTFFVSKNISNFEIDVQYATYAIANDNEIVIPYPYDDLCIPDCLRQHIEFDSEKKTIRKLQPINWNDLNDVFEKNAIENPDLLNIIANLNKIFKSRHAYRRCPFYEHLVVKFDTDFCKVPLCNVNGYISAVKHFVKNGVYSITIMMVNNETIGQGHIFQPRIEVSSDNLKGACFVSYNNITETTHLSSEEKSLDLLYSKRDIYGTGHGVAVNWKIEYGIGKLYTEFMPTYEVPKINLDLRKYTEKECAVKDESLSMKYLSDLDTTSKGRKISDIGQFIDCYNAWIDDLQIERESKNFSERFKETADKHIQQCRESYKRMKDGLRILEADETSWKAFLLANRAMFMQRVHGTFQKGDIYPDDEKRQQEMAQLNYHNIGDENCRWRPFQLAFLLMSVRSITDPKSQDRDLVDLIWFPTGGGKTEAYLGLTAFTIFYRRLKNPLNAGTTVMMRYTLRLLTSQQFTRASTLICACEKIRRDEENNDFKIYNLGNDSITIGLWIGGDHVPNTNDGALKNHKDLTTSFGNLKYRKDKYNKFQVLKCPWCGTKLVKDEIDGKEVGKWGYKFKNRRHFYMSCTQEGCEFESKLPIQIIDEELYSNPPTLLFGTVDKFAMMAWKKDVKAFFGNDKYGSPDLIIQDELHLIAGPLGSMVGIYETAIDYLCSYKGKKPKIIASTATIRQAEQQCRALYNREVRQFPAQGLDASDSFFAKEIPTNDDFGRLYLGVMPAGKTKIMLQARAIAAALQFVHQLDCADQEKDQFYTLTVYFNSLKELGKASSVVSDDVKDFIQRIVYRQIIKRYSARNIGISYELTSRVNTPELNSTLDKLENAIYTEQNIKDHRYPINVLLASNMISVGVDVSRLNLMFIQGQPKSVSEYIQASSRIGRTNPGLAIALYDPSKSRDRSYYEQFKAFHSSFYKYVEPTGVTPFSESAVDRALHAVLLAGARQSIDALNSDTGAQNIIDEEIGKKVSEIAEYIYQRVKTINSYNPKGMKDDSEQIKEHIKYFVEEWIGKAVRFEKLVYGDRYVATDAPKGTPRIIKRFDDKNKDDAQRTLTSLRNVDKTVPVSVVIWENEYE